jgi:hypothetical protein
VKDQGIEMREKREWRRLFKESIFLFEKLSGAKWKVKRVVGHV